MWIAWFLACHPEKERPDSPDPEPDFTSSETSWTMPATETPSFDAALLGQGLDLAVELVWTLDAAPVFEIYQRMMQFGDGYCPYVEDYGATTYGGEADSWYAQCDSSAGATYSGYAYHYLNDYYYPGSLYEGLYLGATVIAPNGTLFSGQGGFEFGEGDYGNVHDTYIYLDGFVEYDGDEADGTWLADGIRPALYAERSSSRSGDWNSLYADGQIAGLPGGVDTVELVEVHLDSDDGCAEPEGVISLRTSAGDWFEVTFDGPDGDCDGCGTARWLGLEMGPVCGDFGPWMTGEVQ
jgi:hypothetical protein